MKKRGGKSTPAAASHGKSTRKQRRRNPLRDAVALWAFLTLTAAALCFLRNQHGTAGLPSPLLPGYGVEVPEYVREDFLPENPYSRPGIGLRKIRGVVIHYVGNPGSSAKGNRSYFASLASGKTGVYASSHFIVGLEGEVIQCVPLTEIAYCTQTRNQDTVSIEVCHPDTGGQFSDVTYNRVTDLTAWLCQTFSLDPETDVIRHYDATGKICPRYYVDHPDAWDALRDAVSRKLDALTAQEGGGA